jgi:chromosome segregation ATPase
LCYSQQAVEKAQVLESELKAREQRLRILSSTAEDYEVMIKNKEADLAAMHTQLSASKAEARALQNKLDSQVKAVDDSNLCAEQAKKEQERLKAGLARTEKELDSLRNLMAARRSEEAQRAEAETSREKELVALRQQLTRLSTQNASDLALAKQALSDLEAKHQDALSQLEKLKGQKAQSEEDLELMLQKLESQQSLLKSAEAVKRGFESDLVDVRQRLIQHQGALAEAVSAREVGARLLRWRES